MRGWTPPVLVALAVFGGGSTAAALTQPNGVVIPTAPGCDGGQPTGLAAELACVCLQPSICNIGAPCPSPTSCDDGQNGDCETTLWHSFNDNTCIPSNLSGLDPQAEASTTPETFKPTCPQTFSLISRGTAMFMDAFGWYNITGSAPEPSDLHVMLDCSSVPGETVVLDLQSEPDYLGGEIGFFLITPESHAAPGSCDGGDCCATVERLQNGVGHAFYSERDFNPDFAGASSYIHLLIYQSHIFDNKFYFAWEDIYGGSNNDFTDVVTGVTGIHCSGGGQPCDTGGLGVCGLGLTVCEQGQLVCDGIFGSGAEICNGVDDDCNGTIDDQATCPSPEDVCHQGSCVPLCETKEFPCVGNKICDTDINLCVHPDCVGVSCNDGQVCRAGDCVAPCEGVICPQGQHCIADKCLDLCAGVACDSGEVCVQGKCLPGCTQCGGVTCDLPLKCDTGTGQCTDPSCPGGCPAGTYCAGGTCVDACEGAICPGGEECVNGECGGTASSSSSGDGGSGGSGGIDPGGAGGGSPLDGDEDASTMPGCSCDLASPRRTGALGLGWLALLGLIARRRRRY